MIHTTEKIGETLKALRKKHKLTQGQLAANSGLNIQTITRLEKGKTSPTIETIEKIVKSLGQEPLCLVFNIPVGQNLQSLSLGFFGTTKQSTHKKKSK